MRGEQERTGAPMVTDARAPIGGLWPNPTGRRTKSGALAPTADPANDAAVWTAATRTKLLRVSRRTPGHASLLRWKLSSSAIRAETAGG